MKRDLMPLQCDVVARVGDKFVTIPKGTKVAYEKELKWSGLVVTHTAHRFRCIFKNAPVVHIVVCPNFQAPPWVQS